MPINSVAVSQDQMGDMKAILVRQRTRFGTSEPERDERSGSFVFDVFASVVPPMRGDFQPDPDMAKVRVLAKEAPAITAGQPVRFVNLRAMYWSNDQASGLSLSADGIEGQMQKREVR